MHLHIGYRFEFILNCLVYNECVFGIVKMGKSPVYLDTFARILLKPGDWPISKQSDPER